MTVTPQQIIGLDLSLSRTGVAMVDGCESIVPKTRGYGRLAFIRDEVLAAAGRRTTVAVIEGYSMGGQRGSSGVGQMIGELGGVVRLALYELGVRIVLVPPASLKKFAVGDIDQADRTKKAVTERAQATLPWPVANHDEADACWLRVIGLHLFGLSGTEVTPWRQEVVDQMLGVLRSEAA